MAVKLYFNKILQFITWVASEHRLSYIMAINDSSSSSSSSHQCKKSKPETSDADRIHRQK